MAFCTSCGTQVQAGGKFCVNCGAPIASLASGLAPFEKPLASTTRSLPSAVVSAKRRTLKPDVRVALASTIFVVPQHWLVSFQNLMVSVSATPLDVVAGSFSVALDLVDALLAVKVILLVCVSSSRRPRWRAESAGNPKACRASVDPRSSPEPTS